MNKSFADSKKLNALFTKYDQVMKAHKTELVPDIFSKKFLAENGGKEGFSEKVKELSKAEVVPLTPENISWKKGTKDGTYFATLKESTDPKNKKEAKTSSQFIIIEEDGKLKIDGTISDGQ